MYKISVPLVRFADYPEESVKQARRLGATRVFLCPCRSTEPEETKQANLEKLKKFIPYYEQSGFEVGVWITTIGHGGEASKEEQERLSFLTNTVGIHGRVCTDSYCPMDPKFIELNKDYIRRIAQSGAKMIQLDDDFRLSLRAGDCGCACEYHMKEFNRRLGGPEIKREELIEKVFVGKPNRARRIWNEVQGDSLRNFVRQMRQVIDEVDPQIRFSACACISTWDEDGVDSLELARIMAGNTKPYLRLIGAPYHPSRNGFGYPMRLGYVAELNRMQAYWCRNSGVEIFSEGDVFPRPRHFVPANYLENYDMILRADGTLDGILKYGVDYGSSPTYEHGYADRAERNKPLYEGIDRMFGGKTAVGVGVSCEMKTFLGREILSERELGPCYTSELWQPEQSFLAAASIPMTYDDSDVQIVFGENARTEKLPAKGGLILDVASARILAERGFDSGLLSAEPVNASMEFFPEIRERVRIDFPSRLFSLKAADGAEPVTFYDEPNTLCASYRYVNRDGIRVFVLGCDAKSAYHTQRYVENYARQEQLISACSWAASKPLPAECAGNPGLYLMCKRGDSSMAVGLWNLFEDEVLSPVIKLDKEYSSAAFLNCSGEMTGNEIRLSKDIPPFGFAAFEVFENGIR